MARWLREPLLHFLLLGAGLFFLHAWVGPLASGVGDRVVISRARVEQLTIGFERMHQRLPNPTELDELIDDTIREEIYYREAKALGLDQDDTIVRRRLRQKLEFVSEDLAPPADPSEAELQAHLQSYPERFRAERRYGLSHVFLDPQRHGARLERDAHTLLTELRRDGTAVDASGRGDASLLPRSFEKISASELSRLFGEKFESALQALPLGQWSGPVASGYGLHLVLLRARDEERVSSLSEAREEVERDWVRVRRAEANAAYYAALRQRYDVTIEAPVASEASSGVASGPQP
jgi:hypothetical protein